MGTNSSVDALLGRKRSAEPEFFSLVKGDGRGEFLEFRFKNGMQTCFSYADLLWFNHDAEAGCLDMEFGGYLITVRGSGLHPELFEGIKEKRVAWIKEGDSKVQASDSNKCVVTQITLHPPGGSSAVPE
jgi:hypothetical protein